MKRRDIGFLIFMLVVGFSVVSAALVVNGNINLSFDNSEFTSNVVFTKANTSDGTAAINGNEQNIDFVTNMLSTVGDTAVLNYEVTNKSRQYDANVTINCGLKDKFTSFNEYFEITNNLTSSFELASAGSKNGKLTIKLKKAYTESETTVGLACTLVASPVGRETLGEEYFYKDSVLNGADPVLDEAGKLVPVKLSTDVTVKKVDSKQVWYDYGNKEWANAIILIDSPSQTYNVNDTIKEDDIESYFVWVPRYRYKLFHTNQADGTETQLATSIAHEIDIEFENRAVNPSTGSTDGEWLTHPAFTNFDVNGIWVGKFATGYKGATSTKGAEKYNSDPNNIIIKPNAYSWRNNILGNFFKAAYNYKRDLDSHMMKNTEWGAVAYLSHSRYGIKNKLRKNFHEDHLTGYASSEDSYIATSTGNSAYNTETGYLASTTGNITGIYDMSAYAKCIVASYNEDYIIYSQEPNEDGTVSMVSGECGLKEYEVNNTYKKYFDVYTYSGTTNYFSYSQRILGDATGEMGPFYSHYAMGYNNWYGDSSVFFKTSSSDGWITRSSLFGFGTDSADLSSTKAMRIVLTNK